jgi:ketosteroid isomerase-like protein
MKKLIVIFGLLTAGAVCMNVGLDNTEADDLAQLKRLNAKFIHNFVTNDAAAHDKILHEKFQCITGQGKWVNRQDYLEDWKTGFDPEKIIYWDYRFEKITIIGTTALVRSVNKCTVLDRGKEITDMTQYTDTYVKENGEWKCIQAQLTVVTPENYPNDETIVKKYIKGKIQ